MASDNGVALARKRSKADTVRILVDEEHARITRGETSADVTTTKRGE